MDDVELRKRIAAVLERDLALPPGPLLADEAFFALGCDSLDVVEMGLILEREAAIDLEGKITGRNMPHNLSALIELLRATLPGEVMAGLASRVGTAS
jgi:acyl carrier protein